MRSIAAVCVLFSVVLAAASTAEAQQRRRFPGSLCQYTTDDNDDMITHFDTAFTPGDDEGRTGFPASKSEHPRSLVCPLILDQDMTLSSGERSLVLDVFDETSTEEVTAEFCLIEATGLSVFCAGDPRTSEDVIVVGSGSNPSYDSGPSQMHLGMPLAFDISSLFALGWVDFYGYINITLPKSDNGVDRTWVRGYTLCNGTGCSADL